MLTYLFNMDRHRKFSSGTNKEDNKIEFEKKFLFYLFFFFLRRKSVSSRVYLFTQLMGIYFNWRSF